MIGESEFQVEKIEKFKDIDYTTKFRINDGPAFKHFDVAVAVGIVENEEKLANRPKGLFALLKRTFGLFVRTGAIDPVTVSASVRDSYFISMSGFRKFGFKKADAATMMPTKIAKVTIDRPFKPPTEKLLFAVVDIIHTPTIL